MQLHETPLAGAFFVAATTLTDERGAFGRLFDAAAFAQHGLDPTLAQASFSFNARAGTLRGLHYQREPWAEAKLVRCTRGRVFDVIVDLRPDSATRLRWFGAELSDDGHEAIYVPRGFAHGFVTLTDRTELHYQISTAYHPESAGGIRWDDPAVGIDWPSEPVVMSERDASYPLLAS